MVLAKVTLGQAEPSGTLSGLKPHEDWPASVMIHRLSTAVASFSDQAELIRNRGQSTELS
jgi:hypothetical protein